MGFKAKVAVIVQAAAAVAGLGLLVYGAVARSEQAVTIGWSLAAVGGIGAGGTALLSRSGAGPGGKGGA